MTVLPREARDGLMLAWLALLRERHPGVSWIAVSADARHLKTSTIERRSQHECD